VRRLNLLLDLRHPGWAGIAVRGDVKREAADTVRAVQWDEKREAGRATLPLTAIMYTSAVAMAL
jgi:hypothetical protein